MTTIRAVVGTVLVLGVTLLVGLPTAGARQDPEGPYTPGAPVLGDLVIEGDDRTVGATVSLVGAGFSPESMVMATIRSNSSGDVVLEMEESADSAGDAVVDVELVDPVVPGSYTASMLGVSVDGATVTLDGGLVVEAPPEPTPTPTAVPEGNVAAPRPTPAPSQETRPPAPTPPTAQPPATPTPRPTDPPEDGAEATEAEVEGATVEAGGDDTATSGDDADDDDDVADDSPDAVAAGDDEAATDDGDAEESAAGPLDTTDDGGSGSAQLIGVIIAAAVVGAGTLILVRLRRT